MFECLNFVIAKTICTLNIVPACVMRSKHSRVKPGSMAALILKAFQGLAESNPEDDPDEVNLTVEAVLMLCNKPVPDAPRPVQAILREFSGENDPCEIFIDLQTVLFRRMGIKDYGAPISGATLSSFYGLIDQEVSSPCAGIIGVCPSEHHLQSISRAYQEHTRQWFSNRVVSCMRRQALAATAVNSLT